MIHARIAPALGFVVALATSGACSPGAAFTEPVKLGGRMVQPHTLEKGRDIYQRYCASCHGIDGHANTAAARQMDPSPRDFTQALFKHKASPGNQLPTDAELTKVIQHGVPGTAMPGWGQLAGSEVDAVAQYIKMFSARWQTESAAPDSGTKAP